MAAVSGNTVLRRVVLFVSACLSERSSAVIIIPDRMLQPLHIIMPLMLITVLGINNSLNN